MTDPRPVRKVKAPVAPDARPVRRTKPEPAPNACPSCASPEVEFLSCVGTAAGSEGATEFLLVVTRVCRACKHQWSTSKPRTDVCAHGRYTKVPCVPCGRTWAVIDARGDDPPDPDDVDPAQENQ